MSLKQKKNKHDKTSNKATSTKGPSRGKTRLNHGKGKGLKSLMGGKKSRKR